MYFGKDNLERAYKPEWDEEDQSWYVGHTDERLKALYEEQFADLDPEEELPVEKIKELRKVLKDPVLASEIATHMALETLYDMRMGREDKTVDPYAFAVMVSGHANTTFRLITDVINPCEDLWPASVSGPGAWIEGIELVAKTTRPFSEQYLALPATNLVADETQAGQDGSVEGIKFVEGAFAKTFQAIIDSWEE